MNERKPFELAFVGDGWIHERKNRNRGQSFSRDPVGMTIRLYGVTTRDEAHKAIAMGTEIASATWEACPLAAITMTPSVESVLLHGECKLVIKVTADNIVDGLAWGPAHRAAIDAARNAAMSVDATRKGWWTDAGE